jgi:DNA-binding response OmpR family regulator
MSALDHRRESVSAGADDFVLKPFSLQDLVATIQGILEG